MICIYQQLYRICKAAQSRLANLLSYTAIAGLSTVGVIPGLNHVIYCIRAAAWSRQEVLHCLRDAGN